MNLQQNSAFLLSIITLQIGLIAAQGLYTSGQKRCDYFSLIKTITFSYLLLFALFYQSPNVVSRSNFILSWILSVALTCIARFGVNTAIRYIRKRGAVCYPAFLICRPEEKEKAANLIGIENCYNLLGWTDINSLLVDQLSFDTTLERISSLGVSEVFVCSWAAIKSRMFLYWNLRNAGITLHILPIDLESVEQKLELRMLGGIPALKLSPPLITGSDF